MKKLFSIFLFCASFFLFNHVSAGAQARAVGVFLSTYSEGIYYQHSINEKQFVEAQLGFNLCSFIPGFGLGADAGVNYEFIFASVPKSKGTFNFWAGPGVLASYGLNAFFHQVKDRNPFVGIVANVGFDFTTHKHFQVFAKISPKFGLVWGNEWSTPGSEDIKFVVRPEIYRIAAGYLIPEFGIAYAF